MAVAFQAAGTAASGTGAVTVAWPTHAIGDVAMLMVESCGGEAVTLSTPAGFVETASSPQFTGAGTAGTRLTLFWCRATTTSMASPIIAAPGNHALGRILTFRGCATDGNPWDSTAGSVQATNTTTITHPSVTTNVPNTVIVNFATHDATGTGAIYSAQANASLTAVTERSDTGTASGNGGHVGAWSGGLAAAGSSGGTTATQTSGVAAMITVAMRAPLAVAIAGGITPSAAFVRKAGKVVPGKLGNFIQYLFGYTVGDTVPGSFARALAAYQYDNNGVLTLIATGTPRDNHWIGGNRYLLLEPSRINYLLQSVSMANAAWSAGGSVVAAPVVTDSISADPVGAAASASRLVLPAVTGAGAFSVVSQNPASQSSAAKTLSQFLKGNAGGEVAYLNSTPDGSAYNRTLCALGTAWRRFSLLTSTNNALYCQVGVDLRDTSEAATAAATIFGWGMQLENGSYPTTPIINTGTQTTRPADVVTVTVPGGAGQVGTLYEKYLDLSTGSLVEQVTTGVTTASTYVPQTGRAWASWKFAVGTFTLQQMQDAVASATATLAGTESSVYHAASGTNTPKTVAGTITPAGVVAKGAVRALAAGVTPTAALSRNARRTLAGSVTPGGLLARGGGKALAAAITPAATSAKVVAKNFAAALTPSSSLARLTARLLAGALNPQASVSKRTARTMSGAITPAAALTAVKGAAKTLAATLTPSGILSRFTARSLAGSVAPHGALTRSTARALSAVLLPLGVLSRAPARVLSASIAPVASRAAATRRSLSAVIASSATLSRLYVAGEVAGRRMLALFRAIR